MNKQKYFVKIENGYIKDISKFGPEEYVEVMVDQIPSDIMNGCYKLSNGELKLDKKKAASVNKKIEAYRKEIQDKKE